MRDSSRSSHAVVMVLCIAVPAVAAITVYGWLGSEAGSYLLPLFVLACPAMHWLLHRSGHGKHDA